MPKGVRGFYLAAMYSPSDLFDLSETEHGRLFAGLEYSWDALKRLKEYLALNLRPGLKNKCEGRAFIGKEVYIGEGTVVEDGVMIKGPAWIGKNCEIRHGAYIRENVIVGNDCVIGNSCELKNSILFNEVAVPHFNYVGDSVLGHRAHLGAGVKISNIKLLPGNIFLDKDGMPLDTGLRKFGAMIGDGAEVGCNAVLNPGTVLGRGSMVYPNVSWRGVLPAHMIAKNKIQPTVVMRRPRETE